MVLAQPGRGLFVRNAVDPGAAHVQRLVQQHQVGGLAGLDRPAPAVLVTQPLVNLSPDAFNATLYYENGPFKARISGSYRDAYLIQVAPSATNSNDVRIKEETFNLDGQVSYELGKMTVTFEAINLTDQEDSKVVDSVRQSSEEYVHYGRQF
ncbi:MAG TPA: hypothetical protein VN157_18450, partial [Caulobacter sp.]|nr:hypothetical protein [Caulobacter sp.]